MNENVIKFCNKVDNEFREFVAKQRNINKRFITPTFDTLSSAVVERIMRLNLEKNFYKIDDNNDLEMVAIATLKQDFIKNYSHNIDKLDLLNRIKNMGISEYLKTYICNQISLLET